MTKPVFSFCILVSQIHSPRLKVSEIGGARNLQICILPGRPDFNVVGLARGKAKISGAKFNDPIVQPEQLQNFLGLGGQLFMLFTGAFRCRDFDQLYLIELMDPQDTARFTAG